MIKFNKDNKEELTYDECLKPAMNIKSKKIANIYKEKYIKYIQSCLETKSDIKAESIVNNNLGYYAGYYDKKTRIRVEKLFDAPHPILGSVL